MRGVGIEVAKNVTLAGAHTITLHDPAPTAMRDLGSNFFLTEADIGKPRDRVCAPRVAELNNLVHVNVGGQTWKRTSTSYRPFPSQPDHPQSDFRLQLDFGSNPIFASTRFLPQPDFGHKPILAP